MNTYCGNQLKIAAETGDIDLLYRVINYDPSILEIIDSIQFVETPLHIATSLGHIRFAIEIMNLKPSFALKLNPQGFSPVHVAMQKDQKRMLSRFVGIKKDLVRIKGREGLTPLHFACQIGDVELLAEFLTACPDSIEDVTVKGETALHIAAKNDQYEALDLLVCFLRKNIERNARMIQDKILNWKDEDDNTILHILAQGNLEPQVVKALGLLLKIGINLKAKNLANKTALDMAANVDIRSILLYAGAKSNSQITNTPTLAHKLKSNTTVMHNMTTVLSRTGSNISEEQRNSWLIVATLVATAMYQSALSPPGGIYQVSAYDSDLNNNMTSSNSTISTNAGNSVLSGLEFSVFVVFNLSSFFLSIMMIIAMIPSGAIVRIVAAPVASFAYSYIFSMLRISPIDDSVWMTLIIFLLILFTLPCIQLFLEIYKLLRN